ncbi:hypothetical protein BS78_10G092800 [Paspalum vaginatum]|nr:hypothetical protein BS78_10G092800 [Paspalum vaginatum]
MRVFRSNSPRCNEVNSELRRSSISAKMVRVSVLNDALKRMYNAEKCGKRQVMVWPPSKDEFEFVNHRSGKIVVELNGRLNRCGVVSPRFDINVKQIESWTARLLPSRQPCCWHHGPRRGEENECGREGLGFLY